MFAFKVPLVIDTLNCECIVANSSFCELSPIRPLNKQKVYILLWISVNFLTAMITFMTEATLGKESFLWWTAGGCSGSWWARHGGRRMRQLATLQIQYRERWNSLGFPPFYLVKSTAHGWCHPHSESIFPPQLNLPGHAVVEMCLSPRHSKSHEAGILNRMQVHRYSVICSAGLPAGGSRRLASFTFYFCRIVSLTFNSSPACLGQHSSSVFESGQVFVSPLPLKDNFLE